jgi:hypothetical protein
MVDVNCTSTVVGVGDYGGGDRHCSVYYEGEIEGKVSSLYMSFPVAVFIASEVVTGGSIELERAR